MTSLPIAGDATPWKTALDPRLPLGRATRQLPRRLRANGQKFSFPVAMANDSLTAVMPETDLPPSHFGPTLWTMVIRARDGDEPTKQAAMESLLSRYYHPIYCHIFARLSSPFRTAERAKDLTHGFITQCLRLSFLKNVDPTKGRFRDFVRRCANNYLRDQHSRWRNREGQEVLSLDETGEDGEHMFEPASSDKPVHSQLDREWALAILRRAVEALRQECEEARRAQLFNALKGHLGWAPEPGSLAEIGGRLRMNEGAVKVAMHRLRERLGELISQEVRQTVGSAEDWREELKYLIEVLAEGNA